MRWERGGEASARREQIHRHLNPGVAQAAEELGNLPGGDEAALDAPALETGLLEGEDVGEQDRVPLHPLHFGHAHHLARAVRKPLDVDDEVERRGHLLAQAHERERNEQFDIRVEISPGAADRAGRADVCLVAAFFEMVVDFVVQPRCAKYVMRWWSAMYRQSSLRYGIISRRAGNFSSGSRGAGMNRLAESSSPSRTGIRTL